MASILKIWPWKAEKNPPMLKRLANKDLFPLLLLAVCLLAFGLFSPFLGFYWDDLPYMWFSHTSGPLGAVRAIALDRPVLGLFYALPMSLLGESPFVWQTFGIFCRWVFALAVYVFLSALFPDHKKTNKLIILLFTVFPGFTQQYIAVIYSHAFLIFSLYFYSLSLFIRSLESGRFFWRGLISIILAVICMTGTEYLVGLEVLRPFIIYLILARKANKSERKSIFLQTLKLWLPFLLADIGFIFYRIFLASSVLYHVKPMGDFAQSPWEALRQLAWAVVQNIYTALIAAWAQIIKPFFALDLRSLASMLYLVVLAGAFIISFIWMLSFIKDDSKNPTHLINSEYVLALSIGGALTLIFAGLPFWAANLQLATQFPADRFLLPFMLASSALIFLLLATFIRRRVFFSALFSLIFTLSLSFNVFQGNIYREEWERFKDFMNQVAWRIPALQENTLLITDELTLKYYSDNSLTAAVNWAYADAHQTGNLPYLLNYTKARLGKSLPSLTPGVPVTHNYRTYTFNGSTSQMILFYHLPPGCFHVADPDLDLFNPLIDASIRPTVAFSQPELIKPGVTQPTAFFLSQGEPQTWCYYYQKASLAAQNQDWQAVTQMGDVAFSLDDYPNDASERAPYIEGYALTGQLQRAVDLTRDTYQVSTLYQPMLCRLWQRISSRSANPDDLAEALAQVSTLLECE